MQSGQDCTLNESQEVERDPSPRPLALAERRSAEPECLTPAKSGCGKLNATGDCGLNLWNDLWIGNRNDFLND